MARRKPRFKGVATQPAQRTAESAWDIQLADPAEAVYKELLRLANEAEVRSDPTNNHCTTLRMVDEVLDKIIPHNPIDRPNALAGNLSNIYRYGKGRIRIFWIASSQKRKVYVLHISDTPRKEGNAYDPYEVFGRMVLSGRFNALFDDLGVRLSDMARSSYASH